LCGKEIAIKRPSTVVAIISLHNTTAVCTKAYQILTKLENEQEIKGLIIYMDQFEIYFFSVNTIINIIPLHVANELVLSMLTSHTACYFFTTLQ